MTGGRPASGRQASRWCETSRSREVREDGCARGSAPWCTRSAVPAWLWLAVVVALAGYEAAALVPLALAAVGVLFGVLSFVMLLARPAMPPLHDQLAGVRPVLRS